MEDNRQKSLFKRFKLSVLHVLEKMGIMKTRTDFLKIIPTQSVGAELGVFQGELSKVLLDIAQPKELHLIDPWWKVGEEYFGDWTRKYNGGELLSKRKAFEQAKANAALSAYADSAIFHVEDDIECLKKFDDHYFDWVYVDSLHTYEHTKKELEVLQFKVNQKGIILGDDWKADPAHPHFEMRKAITEFCEKYDWEMFKLDQRNEQWAIRRKSN